MRTTKVRWGNVVLYVHSSIHSVHWWKCVSDFSISRVKCGNGYGLEASGLMRDTDLYAVLHCFMAFDSDLNRHPEHRLSWRWPNISAPTSERVAQHWVAFYVNMRFVICQLTILYSPNRIRLVCHKQSTKQLFQNFRRRTLYYTEIGITRHLGWM